MDPYRNLPKLWKHIEYQRAVAKALLLRTDIDVPCPTARAYDLRIGKSPTVNQLRSALVYLGLHNTENVPVAKFVRDSVEDIRQRYVREVPNATALTVEEARKFITTFKNYDRLTKGVITKWKKLPMYAR